ncbi:uracil-DNA glycosylase family protein [Aurantivibrio plasticivorans]
MENNSSTIIPLTDLLAEVRACTVCEESLPLGARPVVQISSTAKLLIIGQAPGTKVHATGVPWNDPSGDRLRDWLAMGRDVFYDPSQVAIMPMGFCYPGKGRGGDLPPRPECAEHWHGRLLASMPNVRLTLLVGRYAQQAYLPEKFSTLTECVKQWARYAPLFMPLVHPSPRNRRWLSNNAWFEKEVVPVLRERVAALGLS